MKNKNTLIAILIALFLAVVVTGYVVVSQNTDPTNSSDLETNITSFEECADAGYPVMESYPMRCAIPGGQTFTQQIDEPTVGNQEPQGEQNILLFYYNEEQDRDETGNIQCSVEGLIAVERTIPISQTPLQDAVNLLLAGKLTEQEIAAGITTEFPLPELSLEGVTVDGDGVLVLQFDDPEGSTVGGSCRTNILWQQIQATATQFDTVDHVRFAPEELFQP